MYKVLIIDDEPIIRKGLINILQWNRLGCEICGEASDGATGEELIASLKPDIILTDIRMPRADGLAMMRRVRDLVPKSKIVILTGYRDFNYAQEAVKLGAFDFVLKPSKIEELTAVIQRAAAELSMEKDRHQELNRFKELYEQNLPLMREKLLFNLIYGLYGNEGDMEEQMARFGIKLDEFLVGLIDNESESERGSYEMQLYQLGIINTLEEVLSEDFTFISTVLNSRWLLFVARPLEGFNGATELLEEKLAYLQEMIQNFFSFTLSIAVSSTGRGFKELPIKFAECRQALEHRFYLGRGAIIRYGDLKTFFRYNDHAFLEEYRVQLLNHIKTGNRESLEKVIVDIKDYIRKAPAGDQSLIKSFYLSILTDINAIRNALPDNQREDRPTGVSLNSLYQMIEGCENVEDLNDVLKEAARKAAENISLYNYKNMRLLLRDAVDYLKANYARPVTLNEVAEHLYISTSYLSRMFKKELNINFVDYLNEIRIERAKELLKDARYKTYEAAGAVGISDPHYFSKLFKRYVGQTPTEYRESVI